MRAGTILLGIFSFLGLIQWLNQEAHLEYGKFYWPAFGGNLLVSLTFLATFVWDTELSRRVLFILYAVLSLLEVVCSTFVAFYKIGEEAPWKKACSDLQQ